MQFNIVGLCNNKYVIITSLLVVFGFLLYIIEYEDIGSDVHIPQSNYRFNFEVSKHTFNVEEYHNHNGGISLVGYYDENNKSGTKVILNLKNFPLIKKIINSKTDSDQDKIKNSKIRKIASEKSSAKEDHKPTRVQNIEEKQISTKVTSSTTSTSTTIATSTLKVNKEKTKEKFPDSNLFRKNRVNNAISCAKLISGDDEEQDKAKHIMEKPKASISPQVFINLTKHCDLFKIKKGYITSSLTEEEENFPIAYSMLVFKDIDQVERLLRAIYRPQNVYCIHVDKKSKKLFRDAVKNIASCFENVFVTSKSVDVQWGTFSVLEPELVCLEELWKYKKWKYFINLTGQEFPLRTNLELVKILKIYNGSNDMEGTIKRANKWRFEKAGPVPHGIIPTKGSIHITANRDFIDYVLHNQIAKDFLNWTKKVDVPDETFFTSLNHNPQLKIPGSYTGEPETDNDKKPFLTRFKNWGNPPFNWPCHGQRVRLICIFGTGDLPLLSTRPELFANKFYQYYEHLALDCMEELHYNRTRDEYFQTRIFNTTFYENLEFIKKKI